MPIRSLRSLRVVVLALCAAASTACFSIQTVVKVHPDGTGTIEQTNLVNTSMIGMAAGMAKSAGQAGPDAKVPTADEMFSEAELKKQAEFLGPGVRYVSSERLNQNGMAGAKAIYAFDKVDAINIGSTAQIRDGSVSSGPSGPPMQFALAPSGANHRLTVTLPQPKAAAGNAPAAAASTPAATPQIPPEAFAMIKSMFAGARMSIEVEVDGRIISTNAPATNGSRATLVAVDFAELLSDPSKLQALQSIKPGTDFATVRKALEGMKGVTMPLDQKVTIDFGR